MQQIVWKQIHLAKYKMMFNQANTSIRNCAHRYELKISIQCKHTIKSTRIWALLSSQTRNMRHISLERNSCIPLLRKGPPLTLDSFVCCFLLLFAAVCCHLLQFTAVCCGLLLLGAACCCLLLFPAVCCCLLLFAAVCCLLLALKFILRL